MLKVGDKAPIDNAELAGKYLVLYFYPKDDTPGCTREAGSIRDVRGELDALDVKVVGVSKDSPASHQKFIKKYDLNFTLRSDAEGKLAEAFGVKSRSTFLIDPKGVIIHVWPNVTPDHHGEEIVERVKREK